jgi:hypothetical protein
MTIPLMSEEHAALYDPGWVTPAVLFMCAEECPVSGVVIEAGGGYFSLVQVMEGSGIVFDEDGPVSPDDVAARWEEIADMTDPAPYESAAAVTGRIARLLSPG